MSIFVSSVCSHTISKAAHSLFRCWDPKLCLPRFLKMLVLALYQISNVYFTCGSPSIWTMLGWIFLTMSIYFYLVFSRAFSYVAHSNFWCWDHKLCSLGFLKMLVWSFPNSHVYFTSGGLTLWTMPGLKILAHLFILFFYSRVFAPLAMRHTRAFGEGNPNYAYGAL